MFGRLQGTYILVLKATSAFFFNLGLLGTNDREKVTDFRMRDGYITSDINELLAEYVLSGQKTSVVKNKEILRKESDGCEEEYEQCVGLFQEHYSPMYKCFNTGTNFPYNVSMCFIYQRFKSS